VRTYDHADFPAVRLRAARTQTISVCVPARDEAHAIAGVVAPLVALRDAGVVDQVVVLDDDSCDETAAIAAELGAEVVQPATLLPAFGPVLGKGDSMWRALTVLRGDVVVFVDGDSEDFGAHFACGLAGPLISTPRLQFVKGCYRRPFKAGGGAPVQPTGGGRVTELIARPLLRAFYPDLGAVRQPLAGEIAARRELLERLPFCTGYGVDVALLIDACASAGIGAIAQADLGTRQNRHRPLEQLAPMSAAVLSAVLTRLREEGRIAGENAGGPAAVERPPLASLVTAATLVSS
jgi:glucosyl-3-phosphoglycerate synthase